MLTTAIFLPPLHSLLALDLLLLAGTLSVAAVLLYRARVQKHDEPDRELNNTNDIFDLPRGRSAPFSDRFDSPVNLQTENLPQEYERLEYELRDNDHAEENVSQLSLLDTLPALAPSSQPPQFQSAALPQIESTPQPEIIPLPEAELPSQQPTLYFREESTLSDLYADPIDGTPFTAGEEIWVCHCGAGYHRESWEWLRENLAAKCVHCGDKNIAELRRMLPHA